MSDSDLKVLEKDFYKDMLSLYNTSKKEIGYVASYFLQMLTEYGGVETAVRLISKDGGTSGFTTLWEKHRLDLSVEALVLNPKYKLLFTDEQREMCRTRLEEYGYHVDVQEE